MSNLKGSTDIEVVAINGETVVKKIMSIQQAKFLKRKKGWTYINYQIGFCQIKEKK